MPRLLEDGQQPPTITQYTDSLHLSGPRRNDAWSCIRTSDGTVLLLINIRFDEKFQLHRAHAQIRFPEGPHKTRPRGTDGHVIFGGRRGSSAGVSSTAVRGALCLSTDLFP